MRPFLRPLLYSVPVFIIIMRLDIYMSTWINGTTVKWTAAGLSTDRKKTTLNIHFLHVNKLLTSLDEKKSRM